MLGPDDINMEDAAVMSATHGLDADDANDDDDSVEDDEPEEEEEEDEGEPEGEEEDVSSNDEGDADGSAGKETGKKKRGTYSYPWPENRTKADGAPRFRTHEDYEMAAARILNGANKTQRKKLSSLHGVNFLTCLHVCLPYFDVVRGFAMDVLHDVHLGPVKAALEQTFGRSKVGDHAPYNAQLPLRLPAVIGKLISDRYVALQKFVPAERSVTLRAPHRYHQFFKGTNCHNSFICWCDI
jgi:hypothetical protein